MTNFEPIFLSYSRADYYFAESLTRHILNRGFEIWMDSKDLAPGRFWQKDIEAAIDKAACLVLIISGRSVKSKKVRDEWERAVVQRKRIVLVIFGRARIPPELNDCQRIDFRGVFEKALNELIDLLNGGQQFVSPFSGFPVRLPPWVWFFAIALAIPTIGYLLNVNWAPKNGDPSYVKVLLWTLMPLCMILFAWHACVSFLRRHMGMDRLITWLVFLGVFHLYPLVQYSLRGSAVLNNYPRATVEQLVHHWLVWASLGAVPLVAICVLVIVAPEDVLRWMPTGRAWEWYRAKSAGSCLELAGLRALREARGLRVVSEPDDNVTATFLRELLGTENAETPRRDVMANVLLVTNRTQIALLIEQASRVDTETLIVVGTGIRLPDELESLWQQQWIDFRHWDVDRLAQPKLPSVPEAVTRVSLPQPVKAAHHLICALIGLVFALLGVASVTGATDAEASMAVYIDIWLWVLARKLQRRSIRWSLICINALLAVLSALIFICWELRRALPLGLSWLRALLVIAFLIAMIFFFLNNWGRMRFWFPQFAGIRLRRVKRLGCVRSWQTLFWTVFYFFLWLGVLRLNL